MTLSRGTAELWASWFRAVGDATRVLILHLLASKQRPLTIGEIVAAMDVGQSTVSHHCRILEQAGFIVCEREGTSTRCLINTRCLEMFPSAADVVMGRTPMDDELARDCAPWLRQEAEHLPARRLGRRHAGGKRDWMEAGFARGLGGRAAVSPASLRRRLR